jgi:signal transduction histidine kinase
VRHRAVSGSGALMAGHPMELSSTVQSPPSPRKARRVHHIVQLGYFVRVPAHLCTLLMLVSSFGTTGAPRWVWGMVMFYGLAFPHLARLVASRSRDTKAAELRNLLLDSAFAGSFAALLGFSLWPSVVLLTGVNAASLSVGGAAFALRAFLVCVGSGLIVGALQGFRFTPDSTLTTSIICAVALLGYTSIFSLRTHVEAKRVLKTQRDLKATNERMAEQGQHIEHARDLAEQANRAKTTFLMNMSHELRTPLNAIIGYSEMLEEDLAGPAAAQQREDVRRIRLAGRQLLEQIDDILDVSRIEAGKVVLQLEPFDLGELLDEVASAAQPLMLKNSNQLAMMAAPDLGVMDSDRKRLRQVLLNLLSNSAKFTTRGTVGLTVRQREGDEGDRVLEFEVVDNGIGIEAAKMDKLFQPFVQADATTTRKYSGSGLGLAISHRLCQLMGGDIRVRSEPGRVTSFMVTLPARAPRHV